MRSESGNVIFYILIAVGLLAALSYTVAQSSRGTVSNLTREQAALNASEIIEYGNTLSQAVSQLRLRGYTPQEISFGNAVISGYYNANCTESGCKVFHVNGGAVHYIAPKTEWLDSTKSAGLRYGELYFHGAAHIEGAGTGDDDLILFVPYLKKEICMAINAKLGLTPASDDVPSESHGPFAVNMKFTGSFPDASDRKVSGDATTGEPDILLGKSAGCTEASGTSSTPAVGTYHYFHLLSAR